MAREFPQSEVATWQQNSFEVLTSNVVASRVPGPAPAPEWGPALHQLCELSRKPVPAPSWWTPMSGYFGSVETRTDPSSYHWDGMKRLGRNDTPCLPSISPWLAGGTSKFMGSLRGESHQAQLSLRSCPPLTATTYRRIRLGGPLVGFRFTTRTFWPE